MANAIKDTGGKYTIGSNSTEMFNNAEPYYFGSGSPNINYFLIDGKSIGEDDNSGTTDDIKIQQPDGSAFTIVEEITGFTVGENSSPLTYIKKGTFPKLNKNSPLLEVEAPGAGERLCILRVSYDEKTKQISDIEFTPDIGNDSDYEKDAHSYTDAAAHKSYWKELHSLDDFPTRIGFVLVGAGGGAGGYKAVDTDGCSCGDGGWKFIPGSTGGGGEIVLGVLKIGYPKINCNTKTENNTKKYRWHVYKTVLKDSSGNELLSDKEYNSAEVAEKIIVTQLEVHVANGAGGKGNNGEGKRGGTSPKNGTDGYDTKLEVHFSVKYNNNSYSTWYADVITACGGWGGKAGNYKEDGQLNIYGGNGGRMEHSSTDYFTFVDSITGGNGATIVFTDPPENSYVDKMPAFGKKLYFSNSTPSDNYVYDCSRTELTGNELYWGQDDTRKFWVRGGWSLGSGGANNKAPEKGGGGSSIRKYEGVGGEDDRSDNIDEPTNGAKGWVGLYY